MEEHELRASLRRLPDARPGAQFTAEVLARVERHERRRSPAAGAGAGEAARGGARWRPTLLAGGLAAALVALVGLWQPPGGKEWPGAGGGQVVAPDAPGTERLSEEEGGGGAGGGEGAASESLPTAGHGKEVAEDGPAGGGQHVASVVPRSEGLAEGARGARPAGGAGAADAAQRPTVEIPGAPDPLGTRGGSSSPQGGRSQPSLGDRGSAATDADGSIGEERLASATAVAGGADDVSGAALPAAQRLVRLRAEREALERRLVAFRRELPPAEPPVVLLGGDEGLELVFDLGRWAAAPPGGEAAGAVRPAVHSTQGPPRRF